MNGTVLIVDDSLTVRMDLAEAFEAAGFHSLTCSNAEEARAALTSRKIDLAILDVLLPDTDGVELLKEIRTTLTTSKLPILMLSTEADVRDRIRGLRTGADDYIGKPYDRGYVVARARELLRGSGIQSPATAQAATVLVIDDSTTFREQLREELEQASYEVITAMTGEEGLRLAAARRPAAVIVDGVMPGIDGATVIRRIRLDGALRGLPCLLLTASEDHDAELRALDAGADAFVRKEEDLNVIRARLAAMLRTAQAEPEGVSSLAGPKRILAVDDSMTYLQELAGVLRAEGYDVVLASSGEEALEMLAVQTVDCILLDLLMPGIGGQESCRRIKAAPGLRDTPLIMLTAVEDRRTLIEGLATGADDYISKSSDFDVLRARIQAQIRRKQFEEENRRIREQLLRTEIEAAEARAARQLVEAKAVLVEELERKNEEVRRLNEELELRVIERTRELERAYDDLRRTQQFMMQQERLRALGQMASGVAHDINNAISPVMLYTDSLLESERELSPRARGYLETIGRAIADVAQTVGRMREFYRQRELQVTLAPVDLNRMVQQVIDLTRARWSDMAHQRAIAIEVRTQLAADVSAVMGAESEIRDALTNLIFNAVDAMPQGGTLTLRTKGAGAQHVCVEVVDTGTGMDEETRRRCLEPFFTTKGERGTGLGLAMVYGMVQRHGAEVDIESAVDQGTTVRLRFPTPVALTAEGARPAAPTPALLPTGLHVLLVDDDPVLLKSLSDTLAADGHMPTVSHGGQAGIDAFRAAQESGAAFDVVITDLGMPHVDGREVASAVRALAPSIPIILLTGWGQRLVAEGDIPLHVDRVLGKPPRLRELREALSELARAVD